MNEQEILQKPSKKKTGLLITGLVSIALVVGTFAFYSATNVINNELKTSNAGGTEVIEKFTPDDDWTAGEAVTKEVRVENTGSIPLLVRVKMDETWTRGGTQLITQSSSGTQFNPVNANTGHQIDPIDGTVTNDGSVVYKALDTSEWTKGADGYWYYHYKLTTGNHTNDLLSAITLALDTDMGKNGEIKYYTTSSTEPALTAIGSNAATQWVEYTGSVPSGATFSRSSSAVDPALPGYANATYTLTITTETIEATQAAFDGSPTWSTVPSTVKSGWGL